MEHWITVTMRSIDLLFYWSALEHWSTGEWSNGLGRQCSPWFTYGELGKVQPPASRRQGSGPVVRWGNPMSSGKFQISQSVGHRREERKFQNLHTHQLFLSIFLTTGFLLVVVRIQWAHQIFAQQKFRAFVVEPEDA